VDGFTLDAWVYSIRRGYVRVVSGLPVAKESWIRGSRSPERRDHRYRGQLHVDGPRSSDAVQTAVPQEMAPQRGGEGDPLGWHVDKRECSAACRGEPKASLTDALQNVVLSNDVANLRGWNKSDGEGSLLPPSLPTTPTHNGFHRFRHLQGTFPPYCEDCRHSLNSLPTDHVRPASRKVGVSPRSHSFLASPSSSLLSGSSSREDVVPTCVSTFSLFVIPITLSFPTRLTMLSLRPVWVTCAFVISSRLHPQLTSAPLGQPWNYPWCVVLVRSSDRSLR